jgi:alginate biosynthesis protein Alg44
MKADDMNPKMGTETTTGASAVQAQRSLPGDHESEHALIQLPFVVFLQGRHYQGAGLSLVNAFVTGLAAPEVEDGSKIAAFRFPFDGFSVALQVEVRVEPVDRSTGLYKLVFLHPTGAHLPQLRYILNSFIAGDIVSLGEMMRVPAEKASKPGASQASGGFSFGRFLKRVLGFGVVAAASLGMVFSISYALKNRLFVHDVPALAVVEPAGLALQAPEAGQVAFINQNAGKGQVVYSMQTVKGSVLSVENPCDCPIVLSRQGTVGATVFPGTPVAYAAVAGSDPVLKVQVPDHLAKMLLNGAQAEARMADGSRILTRLTDIETAGTTAEPQSLVTLQPVSGALPQDRVGTTVPLKIVSPRYLDFVSWFEAGLSSAKSYVGDVQVTEFMRLNTEG